MLSPQNKPALGSDFTKAIESVAKLSTPEVVAELVDTVGVGVTALIGDVRDPRYVRAWQDAVQQPQREENLRAGLQATRVIVLGAGPAAAQRWFLGQNGNFDFHSPIAALKKNTPDARAAVLRAAVGFVFH